MLYSKFGSRLTLLSKSEGASERVTVHGTAENNTDVREYQITDLKADGGSAEIDEVIAQLPLKVIVRRPGPPRRPAEVPQRNQRNDRQPPRFRRRSN